MADEAQLADMKKKRTFRKFTYRGVDLDQLLDMNHEQLMELFPCRIRRKFSRGIKVNFEPLLTNSERRILILYLVILKLFFKEQKSHFYL